ncbi:MAG: thiamine-phosphate kinase [Methanomassiliicoccales archaeon]|nr:thiamine-phosphate kinase [Methanomassiliicoccales archaeon]
MSKLSEIGEKEAVRRILAEIAEKESSNAIGPGDDAAAIDMGFVYLVASTDMIAQSTHVLPGMTDWQIGWTVAAVNFSDVAAMGAKPIGLLVSMGLPKDTPSERLDEIIRGILDCCECAGGEMLGGDTKEAPELTLSGTALGTVTKKGILLRKGAKKGDLLAITGSLGLAAAGYQSIKGSLDVKRAEKALLEPKPRVKEGMALSASGVVTSCMDISDGLASSVHTLAEASKVTFEVDYDAIPVDKEVIEIARRASTSPEELVLYYGGDYQLLFTLRPEGLGLLSSLLGDSFTVIGKAKAEGENLLITGSKKKALENRGYEHFRHG